MTDKELKRLKRVDLLELLIAQIRENDQLKKELADVQGQLEEQNLVLEEAGSIAEAALRINKVYQAAQAAVDQYINSINRLGAKKQQSWTQMEQNARDTADRYLREAQFKCQSMETETRRKCEAMLAEAQRKAQTPAGQEVPGQQPQEKEIQPKAPTGGKKSNVEKEK